MARLSIGPTFTLLPSLGEKPSRPSQWTGGMELPDLPTMLYLAQPALLLVQIRKAWREGSRTRKLARGAGFRRPPQAVRLAAQPAAPPLARACAWLLGRRKSPAATRPIGPVSTGRALGGCFPGLATRQTYPVTPCLKAFDLDHSLPTPHPRSAALTLISRTRPPQMVRFQRDVL